MLLENSLDHPSGPLPSQEGGKRYIWGIPPCPHPFGFAQGRLRDFAPLDSSCSATCQKPGDNVSEVYDE